jgi:hypothetical protein
VRWKNVGRRVYEAKPLLEIQEVLCFVSRESRYVLVWIEREDAKELFRRRPLGSAPRHAIVFRSSVIVTDSVFLSISRLEKQVGHEPRVLWEIRETSGSQNRPNHEYCTITQHLFFLWTNIGSIFYPFTTLKANFAKEDQEALQEAGHSIVRKKVAKTKQQKGAAGGVWGAGMLRRTFGRRSGPERDISKGIGWSMGIVFC